MRRVSAEEGRTVLFVSHNMTAINSLCDRALLMDGGRLALDGPSREVVSAYLAPMRGEGGRSRSWTPDTAPGDHRVRVRRVEVVARGEDLERSTPFDIVVDYASAAPSNGLVVEVVVAAPDGATVFHSLSSEDERVGAPARPAGLYRSVCRVPGGLLNAGDYVIDVHFLHGAMTQFTSLPGALTVSIADTAPRGEVIHLGRFLGPVHPKLAWRTERLGDLPGPADAQAPMAEAAR
jgi:lipopolysaccharide transport system ATP-binding protein